MATFHATKDEVFCRYSVAVVTPFQQEPLATDDHASPQAINFDALKGVIKHVAGGLQQLRSQSNIPANSIGGIIMSGSTGENHLLSLEERIALYRFAVEEAQQFCVPVAAGVAATTTQQAVTLANAAVQAGCKGLLLGLPPYLRLSDKEIKAYLLAVHQAVPAEFPILLYNNQQRNSYGPSLELITELSRTGVIMGMKFAAPPTELLPSSLQLLRMNKNLKLYTGSDKLSLQVLDPTEETVHTLITTTPTTVAATSSTESGVSDAAVSATLPRPLYYGITSIMGNIIPKHMGLVVCNTLKLLPATSTVTSSTTPAATITTTATPSAVAAVTAMADAALLAPGLSLPVGVKYSMNKLGVSAGVCRLPLGPITAEHAAGIDLVIEQHSDIFSKKQ